MCLYLGLDDQGRVGSAVSLLSPTPQQPIFLVVVSEEVSGIASLIILQHFTIHDEASLSGEFQDFLVTKLNQIVICQ